MKVLLPEDEVQRGVARMAEEIAARFAGRDISIVGVTLGGVVLLADLIRRIDLPMRVGLIRARSYMGTESGTLSIESSALAESTIVDRDVVLVDDILDTGRTLTALIEEIRRRGARSVAAAVLLRRRRSKPDASTASANPTGSTTQCTEPDFVGFEIPDGFAVGYGLDYNDRFRNLPHVAVLEPEDLDR